MIAAAAAQNGIIVVDEDDRVIRTNDNLKQMFGKVAMGEKIQEAFGEVISRRFEDTSELEEFCRSFSAQSRGFGTQEFALTGPEGWVSINTSNFLQGGEESGGGSGRLRTSHSGNDSSKRLHRRGSCMQLAAWRAVSHTPSIICCKSLELVCRLCN